MSTTTGSAPHRVQDLTGTWTIDPAHTRVGFVARHAMITKVRGAFNAFAGSALVGAGGIEEARIEIAIQVGSVDTRNEQRDGHLKSAEFLDAEAHPTIRFASTKVVADGNTLDVTGDLTIKGVTREVTIPFDFTGAAVDPFGNLRAGFEGGTVVHRRDFGITWNAPLETGGVLVGDKVTLEFEVSAIRDA